MKTFVIITFLILLSGSSYAQFRSDGCGCAIPIADTTAGAERFIPVADMMQQLTYENDKLIYLVNQGDGGLFILDLKSLQEREIVPNAGLPEEQEYGCNSPILCPYDSDLIAVKAAEFVDTNNSGHPTVYVQNIFLCHLSTGKCQLITPQSLGPFGPLAIGIEKWLPGSKSGLDTFVIGYQASSISSDTGFYGLYIPKSQSLIALERPKYGNDTAVFAISQTGHRVVGIDTIWGPHKIRYLYDSLLLNFPRPIQTLWHASFSPNSKLVALTVDPAGVGGGGNILHDNYWDTVFQQVWIFNADDPSPDNVKIINFQCLYCMYNFQGAWAEFLTDSTLAVSMHKDGDTNSWLWEITIDGRIVRQLTGVPQNNEAVQANPLSEHTLKLWPSIATSEITIASDQNISRLIITDILGRVVLEKNYITGDEKEIEIPTTDLITGSYIARIFTGKSFEECNFIVKH